VKKFALIICRGIAGGIMRLTFLHPCADRQALHNPRPRAYGRMEILPKGQRSEPGAPLPIHNASTMPPSLGVLLVWEAMPEYDEGM